MCGGISYKLNKIPQKELEKYFTSTEIDKMKNMKKFQTFFWSKNPVLPIEKDGQIELKLWGNRDSKINLPKTGWAKLESIDKGKWGYLKPETIKILADSGYEKGVWFEIKAGGFKGLLVKKDDDERVYIITKPADVKYLRLTKHNRQPIELK